MTGSAGAPSHGATPGEGGQDSLAAFLESRDAVVQDKLFVHILNRVPQKSDADDLFTITLKAFVDYADGLTEADYWPVLFGIARRKIADFWKVQTRREGLETLHDVSDLGLLTNVLVSPYTEIERRIDVTNALRGLNDQQQRVVTLHYVDRLTLAETALVLDVSVSRIKAIIKNAKDTLEQQGRLAGYGPHPSTLRTSQTGTSEAQA